MNETIKLAWIELVGNDNFNKLRLDENGYSNWKCRQLMNKSLWKYLDSKLRPFKTKQPTGYDLLYRPKSLMNCIKL